MPSSHIEQIAHQNDYSEATRVTRDNPKRFALCDVGLSWQSRENERLRQIERARNLLAYLARKQGK